VYWGKQDKVSSKGQGYCEKVTDKNIVVVWPHRNISGSKDVGRPN